MHPSVVSRHSYRVEKRGDEASSAVKVVPPHYHSTWLEYGKNVPCIRYHTSSIGEIHLEVVWFVDTILGSTLL